ncbi:MAG: hypothetical protein M1820_000197 [Bogoriella megaspora]|nr:MAG: hypothetical protein M1820_000197 [Bogoriella megaspora]
MGTTPLLDPETPDEVFNLKDFDHMNVDCPLIAGDIHLDPPENMLALCPGLDILQSLPQQSMSTVLRTMSTWPRALAKDVDPPAVLHHTQYFSETMPDCLAKCISIAKMWVGQVEGASEMIVSLIQKEMSSLYLHYHTYDEPTIVAALQSLLFYTIMLLFPPNRTSIPFLPPSIFASLLEITVHTSTDGLMLPSEINGNRPSFSDWILISSKRRVIFSLYLLHWSYSVNHGLPSFNCDELGHVMAPPPRWLWRETDKDRWQKLYGKHMAQWEGEEFRMWEYAEIKPGPFLSRRASMWLEDADEFGLMFFSIGE